MRTAGRGGLLQLLREAQCLLGRIDRQHVVAGVHVQRRCLLVEAHELARRGAVLQDADTPLVALDCGPQLTLLPQRSGQLAVQVPEPDQILFPALELEALLPGRDGRVDTAQEECDVAVLLAHARARGRVTPVESARRPVVVECLAVRVERRGSVARRLKQLEGLGVQLLAHGRIEPRLLRQRRGAPVVLGEQGHDLVGAVTRALLDVTRNLEVAARANRLRKHAVGDVADQDVLERELALTRESATAAQGDHQLLLLERAQCVGKVGALLLRKRGQRSRPERAPTDRRMLDQPTLERGKRVEPRGEYSLDGVRQVAVLALLDEALHHLLGEQRIAPGALGDKRHGGVVIGRGEQPGDELVRLVAGQRLEAERRGVAPATSPLRPAFEQVVACQAEEKERRAHPLRKVLDQVEHAVVGPVDVLERDDQRPVLRDCLHDRADGSEEALTQALRVVVARECRRLGRAEAEQAGDRRRVARGVGTVRFCEPRLHPLGELPPRDLGTVPVADFELLAQHLAERPVHDGGAVRRAASGAEVRTARPLAEAALELGEQA